MDDTPDNVAQKQYTLLEMLQLTFSEYATTALTYKQKIDTAKTSTKKKYYENKLKKNNKQALKIMIAIDRLTKIKASKEASKEEIGAN